MAHQPLPDEDHVARYCKPSTVDGHGIPLSAAFRLKQNEEYLSVNWLEYFGASELSGAVEGIRQAFRNKDYQVRPNARFAVLNVGAATSALRESTGTKPGIKHLPFRKDPSHAGIFADTSDHLAIAVELAALVTSENVYPAVA